MSHFCCATEGSLTRRPCVTQCDECHDMEKHGTGLDALPSPTAKNADAVTPEQRLDPHGRRYPWALAIVAGLLLVYSLAQAITDLGAKADVQFTVERTCGI